MQGKETENDCLVWGGVARLNTAVREASRRRGDVSCDGNAVKEQLRLIAEKEHSRRRELWM